MRWGRKLAAIQHSKQTAWTIRDRSCSLPLAIVVVVVVAVVVAKYPPLCLDLSGSGWGAQDTVLRETGRILRDCVFITSFLAWHAECCCSMRRDAHQLPCLYRFPRPTTWFGCSNSVAVRCWCWCWLRAGQKEKREAKLTARSSCPRCDWRAGQSLDGRAWNGRASGCGPRQHAVEERPRLKPLTVSVAATVINHGRFPWHRRDLVGLGSGVPSL